MVKKEDIVNIQWVLEQLKIDLYEYNSDSEDYDKKDLKKEIYNLQDTIRSIVEYWEI